MGNFKQPATHTHTSDNANLRVDSCTSWRAIYFCSSNKSERDTESAFKQRAQSNNKRAKEEKTCPLSSNFLLLLLLLFLLLLRVENLNLNFNFTSDEKLFWLKKRASKAMSFGSILFCVCCSCVFSLKEQQINDSNQQSRLSILSSSILCKKSNLTSSSSS